MNIINKLLKGDKYIWGAYFALCFVSIVAMYSASGMLTYDSDDIYNPIIKHTVFLIIGAVVAISLHRLNYWHLRVLGIPLFVVACILLIYTLLFAEKVNDAARWIIIAGIRIQPSEIAKMGVVITTAFFLAKGQTEKGVSNKYFKYVLAVVIIACVLIFTENLSTAALIGLVSYCMMIIAGVSYKKLGLIFLFVFLFIATILVTANILDKKYPDSDNVFMTLIHRANTWNDRLTDFTKSDDTPPYEVKTDDDNFQEHHAAMAIANGKGIGVGPGNSTERDLLPQAYSDFIYAIILEEYGIWGGLIVMVLYLSILFRAYQITRKCSQAFPAFLMMGIAMLIVFQAIINMMVATGVIPITGQPLPLISRGGTSVIISSVYFAIMQSISHYATIDNSSNKAGGKKVEEIPEGMSAPNPNLDI